MSKNRPPASASPDEHSQRTGRGGAPSPVTVVRLWTRAGGRCEYEHCNRLLYRDHLSLQDCNVSNVAHIRGVRPDAARHTPSHPDVHAFENLMLMCYDHHHLIDHDGREAHPIDRLEAMKAAHEQRIELLTGLGSANKTEVIVLGKAVGSGLPIIPREEWWRAVVADGRSPHRADPIEIGLRNEREAERTAAYWQTGREAIDAALNEEVRPRLRTGTAVHVSIFALAAQPLLVYLGHRLSGTVPASTHQRIKSTQTWGWLPETETPPGEFHVRRPSDRSGVPALVLSISGTISMERVEECFPGQAVSIWEVTVPTPNTDHLRHRVQLDWFTELIRRLLDEIKATHGHRSILHVFPAAPVSVCVELGRQHTQTADLPLLLWDHDHTTRTFVQAFGIGEVQ